MPSRVLKSGVWRFFIMKFEAKWYLNNSVCELIPSKLQDVRGFFSEVYQKEDFLTLGIEDEFMQDNHSLSVNKFTFRGMHLQKPPFEQAKLVRVLQGSILDVVVDLRKSSTTYLQHCLIPVSAEDFNQVFVPVGFAHGFLTLEENTAISYKVSNPYDHSSDVSISVFDNTLGIKLPCSTKEMTFSDKDLHAPMVAQIGDIF